MKIVRIIARLNVGGPAIHVSLVNSEMAKRGHHSLLLTGDVEPGEGDMSYFADALGVPITRIPTLGRRISPSRDQRALRDILTILRREKPDVVHTHTAKGGTLGRTAALMAGVPCIVHTFHGNVLDGYFSPLKTAIFRNIERVLARLTDRVITITPQQKDDLTRVHKIGTPEKVEVIRLGFDLAPLLALPCRLASRNSRAAWVGRLTAVKDPLLFVEAATAVRDVDFQIVGGGEMRDQVQAAISGKQAGHIELVGWKTNMAEVYADTDFVVLTSINEGTPVALIEAMASGLPILSTNAGGVSDLMLGEPVQENGFEIYRNGLLIRDSQPSSIASAIEWLATHPEERIEMGRAGREFVSRIYTKDRLVDELTQLYTSILNSKGVRIDADQRALASIAGR